MSSFQYRYVVLKIWVRSTSLCSLLITSCLSCASVSVSQRSLGSVLSFGCVGIADSDSVFLSTTVLFFFR